MIHFSCTCGKQLQCQEGYAGKRVSCPSCGAQLTIPNPAEMHVRSQAPAAVDVGGNDSSAPPAHARWIIGAAVAGGSILAAIVIVLIIVLGGGGAGDETPDDEPIARIRGTPGGFGLNPVDRVREAADRTQSANNLKQIGIAMLNYNDANQRLPPAVVYDRNGKPLYSWRVLLLPYIDEAQLFREFHFDEPWDSPHNLKLLPRMPKVYAHPRDPSRTNTHYLVFDSPGCAFNSKIQSGGLRAAPFANNGLTPPGNTFEGGVTSRIPATFPDGTSQTILVIEADESVPWTKPVDLTFGSDQRLPRLGRLYSRGLFNVCMADGSVRLLDGSKVSDQTLRAAITAAAGDLLGPDW